MKKASEHKWELLFEPGRVMFGCADPCPEDEQEEVIDGKPWRCWCATADELFDSLEGVVMVAIEPFKADYQDMGPHMPDEEFNGVVKISEVRSGRADVPQ